MAMPRARACDDRACGPDIDDGAALVVAHQRDHGLAKKTWLVRLTARISFQFAAVTLSTSEDVLRDQPKHYLTDRLVM
jgi:hypothetical protein